MKIKPPATPKKPVTKTPPKKKPGKLAKQLKKMNGTSKLEDEFEEILIELEIPYIKHYRFGNREFDFCLSEHNILVECDGCYFHACPICGKEAKYKVQKKSVRNDKHKNRLVEASQDYTLLRFWEHDIKKNRMNVMAEIIEAVNK